MNKRWPKCPKCKRRNVELIEIWSATISWSPEEPYQNDGALMPGDSERVEGNCLDCGHRWRIRGVVQIDPAWFEEGGNS